VRKEVRWWKGGTGRGGSKVRSGFENGSGAELER